MSSLLITTNRGILYPVMQFCKSTGKVYLLLGPYRCEASRCSFYNIGQCEKPLKVG